MKLGAQLFSVRTRIQTPEDLRATFAAIREIGYEAVQFPALPPGRQKRSGMPASNTGCRWSARMCRLTA